MSLEVTQEFIARKYVSAAKRDRQSEAMKRRARLKSLPGYLPVAERPGCRHCGEPLPIYIYSHQRARYGYKGDGVFCRLSCGYWYGVHAAGGRPV